MNLTHVVILGISIIFLMSVIGSSLVFFLKKEISNKTNLIIVGFTAGIMFAASVWSLIIPAIEYAEAYGSLFFIPIVVGIILGGLLMILLDKILVRFNKKREVASNNNKTSRATKILFAIAIHNIPEGLAVGFAFGAALATGDTSVLVVTMGLAIGIGIHNLPEGAATSLPIYLETGSKKKAFFWGVISSLFEPLAAVVGVFLAMKLVVLMPWMLAFAGGAMLFVIINELLPEINTKDNSTLGTWSFIFGFILMIILDALI